jgi:hypothetical protein
MSRFSGQQLFEIRLAVEAVLVKHGFVIEDAGCGMVDFTCPHAHINASLPGEPENELSVNLDFHPIEDEDEQQAS